MKHGDTSASVITICWRTVAVKSRSLLIQVSQFKYDAAACH